MPNPADLTAAPAYRIVVEPPTARVAAGHHDPEHWVRSHLSNPVPADAPFPAEVLPRSKLNFENLECTTSGLARHVAAALDDSAAAREVVASLDDIPKRLIAKSAQWAADHAGKTAEPIPSEQFNLLVVDEFRRASKKAASASRNSHFNRHERAYLREFAELLNDLKRVHYAANVQQLYKAAGERALPELADPASSKPGWASSRERGFGVRGGVEASGDKVGVSIEGKIMSATYRSTTRGDDGVLMVEFGRRTRVTPQVKVSAGKKAPVAGLAGTAAVDGKLDLARQIRSPDEQQVFQLYGERDRHGSRLVKTAARWRRDAHEHLARAGNIVPNLTKRDPRFDPYEPRHASDEKHMKGLFIATRLADRARTLDRLLTGSARAEGPGTARHLIEQAYPSTRQRIEAMPSPEDWSPEDVTRALPSENQTQYGYMPRNAHGIAAPVHAPSSKISVAPRLQVGFGAQGAEVGSDAWNDGVTLAPSAALEVTPISWERSATQSQRLVPMTDYMSVRHTRDFAPVLQQLALAKAAYEQTSPGRAHPQLALLHRHDAMASLAESLGSDATSASGEPGHPAIAAALQPGGLLGDPAALSTEMLSVIQAVTQGRVSPLDLLERIDQEVRRFAHVEANFKADAADAWAYREAPRGAARLHRMNEELFGGGLDLPARPSASDAQELFGRASDALSLALVNLGVQRSLALWLGATLLEHASTQEQGAFQARADAGARVFKARTASLSEHLLPMPKDIALRHATIASVGGSFAASKGHAASLELSPGLTGLPISMIERLHLADELGTLGGELSVKRFAQRAAPNPLREGAYTDLSASLVGAAPIPQLLGPIVELAAVKGGGLGELAGLTHELLAEMKEAPLAGGFGSRGATFTARWRTPPQARGADAQPSTHPEQGERALQYWRATSDADLTRPLWSTNFLKTVQPGMLKIGKSYVATQAKPVIQENGWCPAFNLQEWTSTMRGLMWDTAAKRPLAFDEIARRFQQSPYDTQRLFSRFNPVLHVPALFKQAVVDPHGPRNEFHRILHDADGQRLRQFSSQASRFGADESVPLFGPSAQQAAHADGLFDAISARARDWPPVSPALHDRLAHMTPDARAQWFLTSPEGQRQLTCYMELMETVSQASSIAQNHGRGWRPAVNLGLVESRRPVARTQKPSGPARLARHVRDVLVSTRLRSEQVAKPPPVQAHPVSRGLPIRPPMPTSVLADSAGEESTDL